MAKRKKSDPSIRDWRNEPRYDSEYRSERITIRLTPSEIKAMKLLAAHKGMPLNDYIVCKVLRKVKRVSG